MVVFLVSLWSPSSISSPLTCLMRNMELPCKQSRGIGPHLAVRVNSHVFSRVAAGNWVTFSNYGRDDPIKLVFAQGSQHLGPVKRDNSRISMRLGRAILTVLQVRRETEGPFRVAIMILGFLSIFNKGQASPPIEALNSACLSRCQGI